MGYKGTGNAFHHQYFAGAVRRHLDSMRTRGCGGLLSEKLNAKEKGRQLAVLFLPLAG